MKLLYLLLFCTTISYATNAQNIDHTSWTTLLQKHVSKTGAVNYKTFQNDKKELETYMLLLSKNTPNNSNSKNEKLAFWINAYNGLTIHLILRHYPIKSIKDIKNPWEQKLWQLGEKKYSLSDIEHEILRKMDEPRIHFAIVCASYSCPKLLNEAYTAKHLESQLTKATTHFLSDPNRNNMSSNVLELSKIFQWFSKDFEQNGDLITFLNTYSDIKISAKAKVKYKDYNWDLND